MRYHYTDKYLLNPQHKVTVTLIGCGGTGSQVLSGLARLSTALVALGHPGLFVTVFDGDIVSEANVGRQLFSDSDIGCNKAMISVSRINRFFGFDWQAEPKMFKGKYDSNIYISCVDSAKARVEISKQIAVIRKGEPYTHTKYWLDFGNLQTTGQVVLGTVGHIEQPKSESKPCNMLPNVIKMFPAIKKIKEKDQGPSCSLAEALNKQDLFINSTLANLGLNILWKLFREGRISSHGCYLTLDSMIVNPMRIPA